MSVPAWVSLGSNLGDRDAHLGRAVAALDATPGVTVERCSRRHETRPAGGPAGQGAFLNAVVQLATTLDPHSLLRRLLEIEDQAGRVRTVRWGARPLDLDLLLFGTRVIESADLTVPHPRLPFRRFVLAPLAEIAPDARVEIVGMSAAELLANLDRRPSYLAIDAPAGPLRDALFHGLRASLPCLAIAESEAPRVLNTLVARRRTETLGSARWLITDFCATPEILGDFDLSPLPFGDSGLRFADLVRPTLVVAWDDPKSVDWGFRNDFPLRRATGVVLRPTFSDVDGLLAESLAACHATRGD